MTTAELVRFMRQHLLAVECSASPTGAPQAAVVGFVVTDELEIFFDTDAASRKVDNLRRNPAVALVIGGTTLGDERTVQYEGPTWIRYVDFNQDPPETVEFDQTQLGSSG